MLNYQAEALVKVREYARTKIAESKALVDVFCKPSEVDVSMLIDRVLLNPVTT